MNRLILAAAFATTGFAAIAAIGPSTAQTAPMPAPNGGPDGVQTREDALARADARFDRMDANKDGKLSADEMRPRGPMGGPMGGADTPPPPPADGAAPPPPPPPPAGAPQRGERMFARMDTNGDGVVDRAEYRAFAAQRFDRVDTNKDGKIDADERQAARDAMGQMRGRRGGQPGGDMPPPPPPPPSDKPGQ